MPASLLSTALLISPAGNRAGGAPQPLTIPCSVSYPPYGSIWFVSFLSQPRMHFVTLEKSLQNLPVLQPTVSALHSTPGWQLPMVQSLWRIPALKMRSIRGQRAGKSHPLQCPSLGKHPPAGAGVVDKVFSKLVQLNRYQPKYPQVM